MNNFKYFSQNIFEKDKSTLGIFKKYKVKYRVSI